MGVAYRAWDIERGVPVVIKMPKKELLDDPLLTQRFAREIRAMAAVPHPHIVPIVDHGEDRGGEFAGVPFVAMRFLPGGSLSQRRLRDATGKPLPNHPSTLHLWLPGIAAALDAVHAAGIVHRDVKPANIFFDGFWHSFLGDFGIAKQLQDAGESGRSEEPLTGTNIGIGTPDYMSPEQFSPKAVIDGRSDQYALAVVVYELLTGSTPFSGSTTHFAVEHLTLPPPRLEDRQPGLPSRLCSAVQWALAKDPADRFESCREFAATVLADVQPMAVEYDVVRLLCPECSNILKLKPSAGGRTGKCPRCRKVMNVAKDLGALWLRSEEDEDDRQDSRDKTDSGTISTLTPVSRTTVSMGSRMGWRWPKIDPVVFWTGLLAWASFLVISYILTSHFRPPIHESHEFQQLVADKAKVEGERQELLEENQRLTAQLAQAQDAIAQAEAVRLQAEQRPAEGQPQATPPPSP